MQRNAELVSCCVANCPSPPEPFGQRCGTSERPILDGGTDGSNPVPSSGESSATRLALEILGSVHERGRSPDAVTTAKTAGGMIRQFRLSSGTRRIAHDSVRRSGSAPAAPFARTREEDARPAAFQRLQPVKRWSIAPLVSCSGRGTLPPPHVLR